MPPPQPEYIDLQYIESTGTQYIDTGYKPNNNTECEYVAMQIGAIVSGQSQTFFGCSDGNYDNNAFTASTYRFGSFGWDGSGNQGWQRWSCALNTMYTIKLNNTGAYINGVLKWSTVGYTKTQNTRTLTLFAANYNSITEFSKHRCYRSVIKDGGVSVRNYVPKLRTADGKPGLYDTVNNVFYTNDGTGEFLYA